jgi:hypothetical protein
MNKLTDAQVQQIRTAGLTDTHWSRRLRVQVETIRDARVGRTYKHVATPADVAPRDPTGRHALLNPQARPARARRE